MAAAITEILLVIDCGRRFILAHMRAVLRLDEPRRKAAALRKKPPVRKKRRS